MNEEDVLKDMLEDINNIKILRHMEIAKVDYAKNIMRYTEIDKLVVAEWKYMEIHQLKEPLQN